jgi:hypothetical protein
VGVVAGNSPESIFSAEHFGKPARKGHLTPIDLGFITRKEVGIHLS